MKRVESYEALRKRQRLFWQLSGLAVLLFLVSDLAGSWLLKTYKVSSQSMAPLLTENTFVVSAPSAYGLKLPFAESAQKMYRQPARGDVVVLAHPSTPDMTYIEQFLNRVVRFFSLQQRGTAKSSDALNRPVIKRVVAVPGDLVRIDNFVVYIKQADSQHFLTEHEVSGKVYDTLRDSSVENWDDSLPFSGHMDEILLGENEFFVVNDNRLHTNDSRFFGLISHELIRGKVFLRYWPITKLSFL
ncbi:MAG: signal peptidase I [Spirochaetes bacterium]|nr:signal peptidase I [Spirochaetota bacterium]